MGIRQDVPEPPGAQRICVVLVRPENDGNIGAVARVMANFGVSDLRVVGRDEGWSEETRNRAKHAQWVLEGANTFDSIGDAASDCSLVVGTSGMRESGAKTVFRHFLLPEDLPSRVRDMDSRVALVFGPEGNGLLNEELNMCDLLVSVPTWEGYPILNLSHAVAILCYEWYKAPDSEPVDHTLLSPELRMRLREEISKLARTMPTRDHRRQGIEETLSRVMLRGLPSEDEAHRILGVISAANVAFEQNSP
jgi:TrmH family RNA methyltransferase